MPSATFTCFARAYPAPTYSWYEVNPDDEDAPIAMNVTRKTLTVSDVDLNDNGRQFFCRVTNAEGYVDSDPVTLTVIDSDQPNNPFVPSYWTGFHGFDFDAEAGTMTQDYADDPEVYPWRYPFLNRKINNVEGLQVTMGFVFKSSRSWGADGYTKTCGVGLGNYDVSLDDTAPAEGFHILAGGWAGSEIRFTSGPTAWLPEAPANVATFAQELLPNTDYHVQVVLTVAANAENSELFDVTVHMTIPAAGIDETHTVEGCLYSRTGLLSIGGAIGNLNYSAETNSIHIYNLEIVEQPL